QLRGRIGRGAAKSYCVLMTGGKISPEGQRRLDAMTRTQDGFAIAELDLELRGPGEFFGTKQSGAPAFRVANLIRDRKLLELARIEAQRIVSTEDKQISHAERTTVMSHLKTHWQRRYGLVEVGEGLAALRLPSFPENRDKIQGIFHQLTKTRRFLPKIDEFRCLLRKGTGKEQGNFQNHHR